MMSYDVKYYTRLAGEKLHKRQDEDAINGFKEALKCAKKSSDTETVYKCKFNLGAALVALGRASDGLKVLESVEAPQDDLLLTGDLWYNLCLAHEHLDDTAEAIKCIHQAVKCYGDSVDAAVLKAGCACRLANLYTSLREFERAAEAYAVAASGYSVARDTTQQAICLFQQARLLGCCNKNADAIAAANKCVQLCSEGEQDAGVDIGQLLNDIGLFYALCNEYEKALSCLEKARKIFQWNNKDRKLDAAILQNIGAIYSCLEKYEDAINYSGQASEIYAQINWRSGQCQCFSNMAFAHSQLPDIEKAGEFYLHALQAAKDTGDRTSEYQTLEGLSSVMFLQHKYDRCCEYLKSAIMAASAEGSVNSAAQQRLVDKLADVMQHQLKLQQMTSEYTLPYGPVGSVTDGTAGKSSSIATDQVYVPQDMPDSVQDERQDVREEMSKQLLQSDDKVGSSSEDDSDDDDDDEDDGETEESSTDSDGSDRMDPASLPQNTAPEAPPSSAQNLNNPNSTYVLSPDQQTDRPNAGDDDDEMESTQKYSMTSENDPNYTSILNLSQPNEASSLPMQTNPYNQSETVGESELSRQSPSSVGDPVKSPKSSGTSKDSQTCAVM